MYFGKQSLFITYITLWYIFINTVISFQYKYMYKQSIQNIYHVHVYNSNTYHQYGCTIN